jgi:Tfp pilus assembly protein PilF
LICAAVPVVFYVSSRYRLPLAASLCVPAGVGVAALIDSTASIRRRTWGGALGVFAVAISFVPIATNAVDAARATALANRGSLWAGHGQPERGAQDLRRALAIDPGSTAAWYNLGVLERDVGRIREAEASFRRALREDPGQAEAAASLGSLLVRSGRPADAVEVLRGALAARPGHEACTRNLVVALLEAGQAEQAAREVERAGRLGVALPSGLVDAVERAVAAREEPGKR